MEYKIIESKLSDGSPVYNIRLFDDREKSIIVTCVSEQDANNFIYGMEKLVELHTDEYLTERG